MSHVESFVDIHCHLVPGIDDGARSWEESVSMAEIALADGIGTVVVTPHQLGAFAHNLGDQLRRRTEQLQLLLRQRQLALRVLPGADVRIEPDMIDKLCCGDVLTLADRGKHVLLELPHELYFSLEGVLQSLRQANLVGILSHPERNQGLLKQPKVVESLVDQGCLMQVTASSLTGSFGAASQKFSEWMLQQGLVHFLATDAHGPQSRRPLMRRAFERVAEDCDEETALDLCCRNPAAVVNAGDVIPGRRKAKPRGIRRWFHWNHAA